MQIQPKHMQIMMVLLLTSIFDQIIGLAFYPLLPSMHKNLHISHNAIKFVVPCYLTGFALTQIIAGFLSDQFGRRYIFLSGLLITAVSALLCSMADDLIILMIGFFGQAMGVGFIVPIQNAVVRDVYDEKRESQIFGIINIALAIGGISAPILGGFVEVMWGWRWLFRLLCILGAILLIISFFLLSETSKKENRRKFSWQFLFETAKNLYQNPLYGGALIAFGLLSSAQAAFNTAAPFLLHLTYHLETHAIGMLMAIPTIAMVVGLIVASLLTKFLSYRVMIISGISLSVISALILLGLNFSSFLNITTLIGTISILYFGLGIATPSIWTTALISFNNIVAIAASFLIFFQNLFSIVTSTTIAYAAEVTVTPLAIILVIVTVMALILYPLMTRHNKQLTGSRRAQSKS